MKTLQYLNDAIVEIRRQGLRNEITPSKFNTQNKLLQAARLYIETSPSEEFIKAEISRLKKLVKSVDTRFSEWMAGPDGQEFVKLYPKKSPKTHWNTINSIQPKKKQIKNLEFLLK